ncbi:hypothetical protein D9758_004468 [Tetrapyrgos nigripes]|uniref:TERF2-interacting telomeric protein 1 Myb domain-containing protein n=1 Tax=Tetrapyrgos nigripes TaxID=182062 RepID=A0A8H5GNC6_9AGAR|nr:hypothetical protein D9758_004468 [Tetrapyrgos nigripes]
MAGYYVRNAYTVNDDKNLIAYLANFSEKRGGNQIYKELVDNAGNKWPWSKRHTWQSWRDRYCKNKDFFDQGIRRQLKINEAARQFTGASSRSAAAAIASAKVSASNTSNFDAVDESAGPRKRKRESLPIKPAKPDKRAKVSPETSTGASGSGNRTVERNGSQKSQSAPGRTSDRGEGSSRGVTGPHQAKAVLSLEDSGAEGEEEADEDEDDSGSEGTIRREHAPSDDYSGQLFQSHRRRDEGEDESEDDEDEDAEDDREVNRLLSDAAPVEEFQRMEEDRSEEESSLYASTPEPMDKGKAKAIDAHIPMSIDEEEDSMYAITQDRKGKGKAKATDIPISTDEEHYTPIYPHLHDLPNPIPNSRSSSPSKTKSSKGTQIPTTASPHAQSKSASVSASGPGASSSTHHPGNHTHTQTQRQLQPKSKSQSKTLKSDFISVQSMEEREKELEADDGFEVFEDSPPPTPTSTNVSLGTSTTSVPNGRGRIKTSTSASGGAVAVPKHHHPHRSSVSSHTSGSMSTSMSASGSTMRPYSRPNPNPNPNPTLASSFHRGAPPKLVEKPFGGRRLVGGRNSRTYAQKRAAGGASSSSSSSSSSSASPSSKTRRDHAGGGVKPVESSSSPSSTYIDSMRDVSGRGRLEHRRHEVEAVEAVGEVSRRHNGKNKESTGTGTFKAARRPSKVYSGRSAPAAAHHASSGNRDRSRTAREEERADEDDEDADVDVAVNADMYMAETRNSEPGEHSGSEDDGDTGRDQDMEVDAVEEDGDGYMDLDQDAEPAVYGKRVSRYSPAEDTEVDEEEGNEEDIEAQEEEVNEESDVQHVQRTLTYRNKGKAKPRQLTPTATDHDHSGADEAVPTPASSDDEYYDGPLFTQPPSEAGSPNLSHPFELRTPHSSQSFSKTKSSRSDNDPPSGATTQLQPPSTPLASSSSRTLHRSNGRDPNHISISQLMSPGSTEKVARSLKKIGKFVDKNNAHSPEAMRVSFENLKTFIDEMDTKKKEMVRAYMKGNVVWEEVKKDMKETFQQMRETNGKLTEEEMEYIITEAKARVYRDRGSPIPHNASDPEPFVSEASGTDEEKEPLESKPRLPPLKPVPTNVRSKPQHSSHRPSKSRDAGVSVERRARDSISSSKETRGVTPSPPSIPKQNPARPRHSGPQIFAAPSKIDELLSRYKVPMSGPTKRLVAEPRSRDSLASDTSSFPVPNNSSVDYPAGSDKGKGKAKARDVFDDDVVDSSRSRRNTFGDEAPKPYQDVPKFDLRKLAVQSKVNGSRRSSLPARTSHIPLSASNLPENRLSISTSHHPQTPLSTSRMQAPETEQSTLINALIDSFSSKYQLTPEFVYSVWKDVVDISDTERILQKISRTKTELVDESRRRRSLPNSAASTPSIDFIALQASSSPASGLANEPTSSSQMSTNKTLASRHTPSSLISPNETPASRHTPGSQVSFNEPPSESRPSSMTTSLRQSSSPTTHSTSQSKHRDSQQIQVRKKRRSSPTRRSSSGQFTPLTTNDSGPESDYSPPRSSRAGQMLRLMKQGRWEEALEREHRRASLTGFVERRVDRREYSSGASSSRSPEVRAEVGEREYSRTSPTSGAEKNPGREEEINGASSSRSPELKPEIRRRHWNWEELQEKIVPSASPRNLKKLDELEKLYGDDFITSMTVTILDRIM